jgi:ribosome-associated heat shock protein Hsp15
MSFRMDKFLWAARFFKTRSLSAKACELGRVRANLQLAKSSREVKVGDRLHVETPAGIYEVEVLELSDVRGPAAAAQKLYRETEESKEARRKLAAERKALSDFEKLDPGRPQKRERRRIREFRGRG